MEDLWKSRKPPTPLDLTGLSDILEGRGQAVDRGALNDHAIWTLEQICAVLMLRYETLKKRREEASSLEFDKDDDEVRGWGEEGEGHEWRAPLVRV